jgi:hypothetical protein
MEQTDPTLSPRCIDAFQLRILLHGSGQVRPGHVGSVNWWTASAYKTFLASFDEISSLWNVSLTSLHANRSKCLHSYNRI